VNQAEERIDLGGISITALINQFTDALVRCEKHGPIEHLRRPSPRACIGTETCTHWASGQREEQGRAGQGNEPAKWRARTT
jgi:hypothetical protein